MRARGVLMIEYPQHWTCEVIVLRLEGYLLRTIPLGEALAVAEHLEACDWCAQLVTLKVDQGLRPGGPEFPVGEPGG